MYQNLLPKTKIFTTYPKLVKSFWKYHSGQEVAPVPTILSVEIMKLPIIYVNWFERRMEDLGIE
ncbi:hypothetical protein E1A91_D10G000500v1 [Gossypium mustelinum]|uniref:Uncharacterized protein n=1 Tax=Gossypium mustelinum TaxID=34275 RepID=A0A5D2T256_GOSMU|nr:hypothetical protein E1A91_D10G000500v1 [Gossypium mustelinum]